MLMSNIRRALGQSDEDEQTGVVNPRRLRLLRVLDVGGIAVSALLAWLAVYLTPHESVLHATIAIAIVFPPGAWFIYRRRGRARAYARGWLDGRRLMFQSVEEAMRRDMTAEEWFQTEMERDVKVIQHL